MYIIRVILTAATIALLLIALFIISCISAYIIGRKTRITSRFKAENTLPLIFTLIPIPATFTLIISIIADTTSLSTAVKAVVVALTAMISLAGELIAAFGLALDDTMMLEISGDEIREYSR